ncbi:DUF4465 domain-containing protein [Natronoflexus pectinivorans]|uniref:PKD family protein n=1 Tax=Natronoflexus pectinivorans TaxID=682526 RepID=A0A4R2GG64_9BACT|nr:DUF4465 domain-containing protein [Natronoflexus pectinivorans]TCO06951.1 PKD family protein [Natronoflexus pectinivorans]
MRYRLFLKGIIFIISAVMVLTITACENHEKEIPPPGIHINMPDTGLEIELEDTLVISPRITYNYDTNYRWYLNGEFMSTEKEIKHIGKELGTSFYSFVVESPSGSDSIVIPVNTVILINFNEFELKNDTAIVGLDIYPSEPGFRTKGAIFPTIAPSENQWVGYALSNKYSQQSVQTPGRFTAYATTRNRNPFMVYHQPVDPHIVAFYFENREERLISSMSVSNTQLTFLIMRFGTVDGIPRFGGENNDVKDWFILTIEGFDANGVKTGEIEFPLADFRFDNHRQNYIVNNWQTVSLSDLGKVNSVSLSLATSLTDENGMMLTPPYVCIDNIRIIE